MSQRARLVWSFLNERGRVADARRDMTAPTAAAPSGRCGTCAGQLLEPALLLGWSTRTCSATPRTRRAIGGHSQGNRQIKRSQF